MDHTFVEFVAQKGAALFDDKTKPLAERIQAATQVMDGITEDDGKLYLIKQVF